MSDRGLLLAEGVHPDACLTILPQIGAGLYNSHPGGRVSVHVSETLLSAHCFAK